MLILCSTYILPPLCSFCSFFKGFFFVPSTKKKSMQHDDSDERKIMMLTEFNGWCLLSIDSSFPLSTWRIFKLVYSFTATSLCYFFLLFSFIRNLHRWNEKQIGKQQIGKRMRFWRAFNRKFLRLKILNEISFENFWGLTEVYWKGSLSHELTKIR